MRAGRHVTRATGYVAVPFLGAIYGLYRLATWLGGFGHRTGRRR